MCVSFDDILSLLMSVTNDDSTNPSLLDRIEREEREAPLHAAVNK